MHAIINPRHKIEFPDISEKDLLDVLKVRARKQQMFVLVIGRLYSSYLCLVFMFSMIKDTLYCIILKQSQLKK